MALLEIPTIEIGSTVIRKSHIINLYRALIGLDTYENVYNPSQLLQLSASNGQGLIWNSSLSQWIPGNISATVSPSDITSGSAINGNIMIYNSSNSVWETRNLFLTDIHISESIVNNAICTYNSASNQLELITFNLNNYISSSTNDAFMYWSTASNNWETKLITLDSLLTSSSINQYLFLNSNSEWITKEITLTTLISSSTNEQFLYINSNSEWATRTIAPSLLTKENATNGQVLAWNNTANKWEPTTIETSSGSSNTTIVYTDERSYSNDFLFEQYTNTVLSNQFPYSIFGNIDSESYNFNYDNLFSSSINHINFEFCTIVDKWYNHQLISNSTAIITSSNAKVYSGISSSLQWNSSSASMNNLNSLMKWNQSNDLIKITSDSPIIINYNTTTSNLKYIWLKQLTKENLDSWTSENKKLYIDAYINSEWTEIAIVDNIEKPCTTNNTCSIRYSYNKIVWIQSESWTNGYETIVITLNSDNINNVDKLRLRTDSKIWFSGIQTFDKYSYQKYDTIRNTNFSRSYYNNSMSSYSFEEYSEYGKIDAIAWYNISNSKHEFLREGYLNAVDLYNTLTNYNWEIDMTYNNIYSNISYLYEYVINNYHKGKPLYWYDYSIHSNLVNCESNYYQKIGHYLYDSKFIYINLIDSNIESIQFEKVFDGSKLEQKTNKRVDVDFWSSI